MDPLTGEDGRAAPGPDASEIARTLARVDHLVLATPDVDDTADRLTTMLGVRAVPGGKHPEWGTRNALVALGDLVYLEIVGPDLEGPAPATPRPYGLDAMHAPRLVTWAVRGRALDALVREARGKGVELGPVQRRTRRRPDAVLLGWSMTDLAAPRSDGVIPFFIDWGTTPHPSTTSPQGGSLVGIRARHPEAEVVRATLQSLGLALDVVHGETPELIATLETRKGRIELR